MLTTVHFFSDFHVPPQYQIIIYCGVKKKNYPDHTPQEVYMFEYLSQL